MFPLVFDHLCEPEPTIAKFTVQSYSASANRDVTVKQSVSNSVVTLTLSYDTQQQLQQQQQIQSTAVDSR